MFSRHEEKARRWTFSCESLSKTFAALKVSHPAARSTFLVEKKCEF